MKRLTENTAVKIASVIISYALAVILCVSAAATGIMVYYKFYFSNEETVKKEIMTDMAHSETYYALQIWYWEGADLEEYYSDKNVYYKIHDIRNDKTYTNYNGEAYIATAKGEYYDDLARSEVDPKTGKAIWYSAEERVATCEIFVAEKMSNNDRFSVILKIIELGFRLEYAVIFITLISLICLISLWCFSFCGAGKKSGGRVELGFLDKIPFDFATAAVTAAAVLSVIIIANINDFSELIIVFLVASADYFIGLLYLLSLAVRIKTKTLIKNNIICYVLRYIVKQLKKFGEWLRFVFSGVGLIHKTIIILTAIIVVEFFTVVMCFNIFYYFDRDLFIIGLILINIVFILVCLYLAVVMQRIKSGGEKIAGGELEHKIDTKYMIGDFKDFSESLNNINEGLQNAVNEKMKSERFKTELITNVSHDIKTPLTSIINYVDLIKKENCDNEKIKEYVGVLDRHSLRLKKLVEDLVEASKASTGNLSVDLMPCDVGVLLNQALGEFEEKLAKTGVTPIINLSEKPIKILADGRHLWRIFDNLLNNVCKYALLGTRVYIDVANNGDNAVITFRNISRYELNISSDELMERFVRGDSSRNTEGSGLGLSIAKSLTELQNGNMSLSVDGDLFKVTLTFKII